MFRAVRKRKRAPPRAVLATAPDSSEGEGSEEGGEAPSEARGRTKGLGGEGEEREGRKKMMKKKKKKGMSIGIGIGIDAGDDDDDDDDDDAGRSGRGERGSRKKRSRRKRSGKMGGGMGFGGGGASLLVAGGGGESPRPPPPPPPPWGVTDACPAAEGRGGEEEGGSLYGKAAMERLRASQKAFVASKGGREEDGPAQAQAQAPSGSGPIAPPTGGSPRPGTNFLPPSGGVLAGDEALAFMEEGDDEREGFADPSSGGGRWGGGRGRTGWADRPERTGGTPCSGPPMPMPTPMPMPMPMPTSTPGGGGGRRPSPAARGPPRPGPGLDLDLDMPPLGGIPAAGARAGRRWRP